MKPGDLVRGKSDMVVNSYMQFTPMTGILLGRIESAGPNRWWRILCTDGSITEEIERYIEVISEAR